LFLAGGSRLVEKGSSTAVSDEVEKWLSHHGFVNGNPFQTIAADEERHILSSERLFVPVKGYDLIRSAQTVLVFAPRGGGKSALRVRLADISLPLRAGEKTNTLAVEITDFSGFMEKVRQGIRLTESDYAQFLLQKAAQALFASFVPPVSVHSDFRRDKDLAERVGRTAVLPPVIRSRIATFFRSHAADIFLPHNLYQAMHSVEPAIQPEWPSFRVAAENQQLLSFIHEVYPETHAIIKLIADLNDEPESLSSNSDTILNHFEELVCLAEAVGIETIFFLFDRLDEMQALADDFEMQADILEPLLAYLNLLELPGLSFKFFLAQELHEVLLERPKIRRDRLLDKAVQIAWDEEMLRELLNGRLQFYSNDEVPSLASLCAEGDESIEKEMLTFAMKSPRRLLTAGQYLCRARVVSDEKSIYFLRSDWQTAKIQVLRLMPPTLLLRLEERLVIKAGEQITVTKNEAKILQAMVDMDGIIEFDELAYRVWGAKDGVSDEAVDQAIKRLQGKIEANNNQQVYLRKLRGTKKLFHLRYYEIEDSIVN
jgi:hypothetical protein